MDFSHEHVAVAVHEAHLALSRDLNLVKLHFDDVSSMLNNFTRLARVDVESVDFLGVARINDSNNVRRDRQVALVEEFNSESLHSGLTHKFTFIAVYIEVLRSVDNSEELSALDNHVDVVLQVEYEGRGPVLSLKRVDVALGGGADDHVSVLHAHVDNALSEVKFFTQLVKTVTDVDLVVFVKNSFAAAPA